jgi:inner membrane protein
MFIGHLPAGYLATTLLLDRAGAPAASRRRLLIVGLIASVLPDLDLLWFFTVGQRRQVHHAYLPHLPLACAAFFAAAALLLWTLRARRETWLGWMVAVVNVMLHLVLDTTAGGIRWLWPLSDAELALGHVQARHDPWVLNFVLHWTFALEVLLVAAALVLLWRRRESARTKS